MSKFDSTMRRAWAAVARAIILAMLIPASVAAGQEKPAPAAVVDHRLDWWRDARFGMFIHWGLYAIPAGEWKGQTHHGEWIMNTGHIPVEEYERFRERFNPVKFDAGAIVRAAKQAGMQYIVITSKHHDGFSMFDSKQTDYDVMSTPFSRDIMKEMAEACRSEGLRMCWYYSIMDWHHPDYVPRRDWETRSADGADPGRYIEYMKAQLRELLTEYGPIGVLWFDGQWEGTWNNERGRDLYQFVRGLQPDIIINNRVGRAGGDFGLDRERGQLGDFGTPEQEIAATGLPGIDWETCMTMNDHWGYNKADKNFKSTEDLIHKLVDIASKGGNFLLNISPTAEGEIPPESIERLTQIGKWMAVNGESIHGTGASPFRTVQWGRCTQRPIDGGATRLYLHVFQWPADATLIIDGIANETKGAYLLGDPEKRPLHVARRDDAIVIQLPASVPDAIDSVIVLDVIGQPDVVNLPSIIADPNIFVDDLEVTLQSERNDVEIRYTIDGGDPAAHSPVATIPVRVHQTSKVSARCFRDGKAVSAIARATFTKVAPRPAEAISGIQPGVQYEYVEGNFRRLPEFESFAAVKSGVLEQFDLAPRSRDKQFAFRFRGYVRVPADGVYRLFTRSDDGSRLWIGDQLVVENDGLHSAHEESGVIALAAGLHPISVAMFQQSGEMDLVVSWSGPGVVKQRIPASALFRPE